MLIMQKQYEIVTTDFVRWDNQIKRIWQNYKIYYSNLTIIASDELVSILIQNLKRFGNLKFENSIIWIVQLFNLIWYKKYVIE
jgi:hypothetical protein